MFSCQLIEHELEPGAKPIAEKLRGRPQVKIDEARCRIEQMLAEGVLEPNDSPYSSAYLLVTKKGGTKRFCIDFRRLSDQTCKCAYPLNIEHCLDSLAGKSYFSCLDSASGYWQVPVASESRPATASRTETGLYQCVRMPFGLCNSPATFQRMMDLISAEVRGMNLQVLLEDVCVATHSWGEHLQMLDDVLKLVELGWS